MRGIEDTRLVDDEARADAARLLDELDARFGEFGDLARRDRVGILAVMTRHISVEAGDKFLVGDRFGGGEEAGRRRSEEHTSARQSLLRDSDTVVCTTKKTT